MFQLKTQSHINAPAQKVYDILMDFANYGKWNPFVTDISGDAAVGGTLSVTLQMPDAKPMTIKPKVTVNEPNKGFAWNGKILVGAIFNGDHYFKIEEQPDGTTIFHHGEDFSGLLVSLIKGTLAKSEPAYQSMCDAMKAHAESQNA